MRTQQLMGAFAGIEHGPSKESYNGSITTVGTELNYTIRNPAANC